MKKRLLCLLLAALAVASCTGAAWAGAAGSGAAEPLYCHSHGGGHHGGGRGHHGHHGSKETCDWLFHAWEDCWDVDCTDEEHAHRCPTDCTDEEHHHYGVCRYGDGTLALTKKRA